ncbi:MAG: hypothetical protein HN704_11520 [Bacteroidetes bacterium]|nr:hypothetical protein [Bacteroidota bacterium]MBT6685701.1 hypothetical protein [Bacteroidota bacterium]MBT7143496.1 hypothetical protein [Bacteroidota bacterium]MBT7492221.1 hypothetical protein [Bacteroidota bacterium]
MNRLINRNRNQIVLNSTRYLNNGIASILFVNQSKANHKTKNKIKISINKFINNY